ncbi:hypothetical protein J3R30DRAFT_2099517 [Lentinula aciculospora]|uniref:Phosphatidate phosphatase APP1 catalytic domain-containing protein n=1 Tax=Lentinula aciculospora TaxID=153920 RepID=A0A9W9AJG1_9AGAR|nr:hypothetical protein J3R30DRAFT_2099517 [Lentinula aciculospora]
MKFNLITLAWITAFVALHAHSLPLSPHSVTSTLLLHGMGFHRSGSLHARQEVAMVQDTLSVSIQAFVHLKKSTLIKEILAHISKQHPHIEHSKMEIAMERMKLFGAIGVPFDKVNLVVDGCGPGKDVALPRTSVKELGVVVASVSLGSCQSHILTAHAANANAAKIFSSPPTGFGVISDIDDTIKITDVLNHEKMIENTLYKDPVPVAGMPNLYASLAKSLTMNSIPPQFIYLSGSPFQLFPFLDSFLSSYFPASLGPLLLHPLSLTDPKEILKSFGDGREGKIDYKVEQIKRIYDGIYPGKFFLAVGDSGESDPEAYGEAFNRFSKSSNKYFIRCIWIHLVDGADNSEERFEKAFKGVPDDRILKFSTSEIPRLQNINVAGGKCK